MATKYISLAGDGSEDVNYIEEPSPSDEYPDNEHLAVFGAMQLPRVYGKNLTHFEVASSGVIALSVTDTHTVNFGRSTERDKTTYLGTVPDESLYLALGNSNASIYLDAENSNIEINSSNIINLSAPNGVNISSSDASFTPDGELYLSAGDESEMLFKDGDITAAASGTLSLNSSNLLALYALSNVHITAQEEDIKLSAADSNVTLDMLHGDHKMAIFANSNIELSASNDLLATAKNTMELSAADQGVKVSLDSSTKNLELSADNNVDVFPTNDLILRNAEGSVTTTFDRSAHALFQYANSNISASASNDYLLTAKSDMVLSAAEDDLSLTLDAATKDASLFAFNNINMTASNDGTYHASRDAVFRGESNITMERSDGGDAFIKLKDDNSLETSADSHVHRGKNTYTFRLNDSNMFIIEQDTITINANLDVMGTINSINVTNTELEVQDKTILLSAPEDDSTVIEDGDDNTRSGLLVAGFPEGVDSNIEENQEKYEKSMRWHYNVGGIDDMLTRDGLTKESYWEVRGGSLRLSAYKGDGTDISFGFRINERDELEFVKRWTDSSDVEHFKRVAMFGKTML